MSRKFMQVAAIKVVILTLLACSAATGLGSGPSLAEPTTEPPDQAEATVSIQVAAQPPETLPLPKELTLPPVKGSDGSLFDAAKVPQVSLAAMPIDLPSALRLAARDNLEIAQAQQMVQLRGAGLLRAEVIAVPNANFSSTYLDHTGRIQQAIGNIAFTNRQSLWVGGGPSLTFQLSDAIFQPLAARQQVAAADAGVARVTLATLLDTADAYFNILYARRRLALIDETLDFLTSEAPSPKRGDAKGLYPLVRDFVKAGRAEALKADEARVLVEVFRRQEERRKALQDFEVASAGLARVMYLDPRTFLWPVEDFRFPVPLPGQVWMVQDYDRLIEAAVNNRPDLAENQALIRGALNLWRAAKVKPLTPILVFNFASGGFGGGPNSTNKVPGSGLSVSAATPQTHSGYIDYFGGRSDFEATALWRLQNLGLGNLAEMREMRTLYNQTRLRQLQILEQVMGQIVQAKEQLEGSRQRLDIVRGALFDDKNEAGGPVFVSLRLNFARIRNVEGARPLEIQNSIAQLYELLDKYASAVTDYERAQFRLLIALGLPPAALFDPEAMPRPAINDQPGRDGDVQRRLDAPKEN